MWIFSFSASSAKKEKIFSRFIENSDDEDESEREREKKMDKNQFLKYKKNYHWALSLKPLNHSFWKEKEEKKKILSEWECKLNKSWIFSC